MPWTQPVLGSNNTIGGTNYGCYTTCAYNPATAYQAFDLDSSTAALNYFPSPNANKGDLIFYSPYFIKLTSITMDGYCVVQGTVSYSDDNTNWYECGSYNRGTWGRGTWTFNLATDGKYHQWWKFWYYNSAGTSAPQIFSITMVGTKWDYDGDPVAHAWTSKNRSSYFIKY